MRSKTAPDAAKTFKKMISTAEKCNRRKFGQTREPNSKEHSKICAIREDKQHIQLPAKQSQLLQGETFVPLKTSCTNTICQHSQLTRESCNKVGPKECFEEARATFTISSFRAVEQNCQTPKFNLRDEVRIAKQDLPFKKGHTQNFLQWTNLTFTGISRFNEYIQRQQNTSVL